MSPPPKLKEEDRRNVSTVEEMSLSKSDYSKRPDNRGQSHGDCTQSYGDNVCGMSAGISSREEYTAYVHAEYLFIVHLYIVFHRVTKDV